MATRECTSTAHSVHGTRPSPARCENHCGGRGCARPGPPPRHSICSPVLCASTCAGASFEGSNDIGVFSRLTNSYCIVALGGAAGFYSLFESELAEHIPVIHASIAGCRFVGRVTAGALRPARCAQRKAPLESRGTAAVTTAAAAGSNRHGSRLWGQLVGSQAAAAAGDGTRWTAVIIGSTSSWRLGREGCPAAADASCRPPRTSAIQQQQQQLQPIAWRSSV